jgi:CDP-diglyceride synthetase
MHFWLQSLWLAAPVIAGGTLHILAMKAGVLQGLARVPIDGGLMFRSRRIFGDNKTLRGALLMTTLTTTCAVGQAALENHFEWARAWTLPGAGTLNPIRWGALLGLGYVAGELPNSFLKRQLDIKPGGAGRGVWAPVFWVIDQVDSLGGTLLAMPLMWTPPIEAVAALLVITLVVHPMAAAGMVALGLKQRVG